MWDTAREARMNSSVTFFYRPPARTYLHQFCAVTGCNLEGLPGAMNDRERESGKSILSAWLDDESLLVQANGYSSENIVYLPSKIMSII